MSKKKDLVIEEDLGKLGECRWIETRRKDGSIRIQQDFSACPTMTDQHSAYLTDINYLVERYKPDELSAFLVARGMYKREILGHDFSTEPTLQESMNHVHDLKEAFKNMDPRITGQFGNHFEFYKFMCNPANQDKMVELGLMTREEVKAVVDVPRPVSGGAAPEVPLAPTTPS